MATKVFIGFDAKIDGNEGDEPTTWANTAKPQGVYTYEFAVAKNPTAYTNPVDGPLYVSGYPRPGRHPDSNSWGTTDVLTLVRECYLAVDRSVHDIGNEVFVSFDIRTTYGYDGYAATNPASIGYASTVWTYQYPIFRWGQMQVVMKYMPEKTAVGATFDDIVHTARFSVQDNGVEVAVITVPNRTNQTWAYVKIWCKLDAATGGIDVNIDGYAQSAAYTSQDTVDTIALASTGSKTSADLIWFGPPMGTGGGGGAVPSVNSGGVIDNIIICDTDYPPGRPHARRWTMGTAAVNTNFAAVGSGATTIPLALRNSSDAKAARGSGDGARTTIGITAGDLEAADAVALMDEMIGVDIFLQRPTKRTSDVDLRMKGGLLISAVEYWGDKAETNTLSLDTTSPPPAVTYPVSGIHEGVYTPDLTLTNFDSSGIMVEVLIAP